jgi:hypothetical protein
MIERIDRNRIIGLSEAELDLYVESDFRIRSGMCPNEHGLLHDDGNVQRCETCGFVTNVRPEGMNQ